MAILGGTTTEVVMSILGGRSPDLGLNPLIWQELQKLYTAVFELAAAVDVIKASASADPEFYTVGSVNTNMQLQDMAKIDAIAVRNLAANSPVRFYAGGGGVIYAEVAPGTLAHGYTASAVSAGVVATFILKGMASAILSCYALGADRRSTGTGIDCNWAGSPGAAHYRLSTIYLLPVTNIFAREYAWYGTYVWKNGPTYYANSNVGTRLGVSGFSTLMYFNPDNSA